MGKATIYAAQDPEFAGIWLDLVLSIRSLRELGLYGLVVLSLITIEKKITHCHP